jgi:hypothetical protein
MCHCHPFYRVKILSIFLKIRHSPHDLKTKLSLELFYRCLQFFLFNLPLLSNTLAA